MAPSDDDRDETILELSPAETYRSALSTEDSTRDWLDSIGFTQTYTAVRAPYRTWYAGTGHRHRRHCDCRISHPNWSEPVWAHVGPARPGPFGETNDRSGMMARCAAA